MSTPQEGTMQIQLFKAPHVDDEGTHSEVLCAAVLGLNLQRDEKLVSTLSEALLNHQKNGEPILLVFEDDVEIGWMR